MKKKKKKPIRRDAPHDLAPPAANAPSIPRWKVPRDGTSSRVIVLPAQLESAEALAAQLEGSASLGVDFGACAPPPAIVEALRIARSWSLETARTDAWQAYARAERDRAWRYVLAALAPLVKSLRALVARDRSIANRYSALMHFAGAYGFRAKRAAATRRKKKRSKRPAPGA
jgi:hypothetical protein